MKLSDYVIDFLYQKGVRNCFLVSGGAVLHLVNSANEHPGMNIVCSQHEQASVTAADAVSRVSENEIGFCLATSGPGATNLLTGICNAYFDFIPLIAITGQVASFRKKGSKDLRQLGFQETAVEEIFKPVTKYTVCLKDPMEIRYEMEKAFFIAREGRPGPVIIDIPDDFQRVEIDPNHLRAFKPENSEMIYDYDNLEIEIDSLIATIEKAEKPILILGAGFHISKSSKFARELSSKLGIPTLLTWGAKDLLPFADEINLGGLGVCGSRLGNWAIQASDLVIVVGSRLSQMITGSKLGSFAPLATKVMIDIEKEEFKKFKKTELKIDHFINVDIKILEVAFRNRSKPKLTDSAIEWKTRLFSLRQEYNVVKENMNSTSNINVYKFMKILSDEIEHEDIVITDAGGNLSWTMQAFENKQNQRLFSAWNHSPMGYSMPAAIGASLARSNTRIISIIGDGGIMMCLEEIATIVRNSLNIKIIIINNLGHGIQKQTIETWLENKYVGVDEKTGLNFPNFEVLSKAFGIKYAKISSNESIHNILRGNDFGSNLPQIIEVMIDPQERITPMLKFGSGIENLSPEVPIPVL